MSEEITNFWDIIILIIVILISAILSGIITYHFFGYMLRGTTK